MGGARKRQGKNPDKKPGKGRRGKYRRSFHSSDSEDSPGDESFAAEETSSDEFSAAEKDPGKALLHARMAPPPKKKGGLSPTVLGLVLLLTLAVTGGVYIYNFVDVPELIEDIQQRTAAILGTQETHKPHLEDPPVTQPPPVHDPAPTEAPPTDEQAALPTDKQEAPPTDEEAPPTDNKEAPPTDKQKAPPTDKQEAPPTDKQKAPPTDKQEAPPTDKQEALLTDKQEAPPTDKQEAPPTDKQEAPPTDKQEAPPTDKREAPPTDQKEAPDTKKQQTVEDVDKKAPVEASADKIKSTESVEKNADSSARKVQDIHSDTEDDSKAADEKNKAHDVPREQTKSVKPTKVDKDEDAVKKEEPGEVPRASTEERPNTDSKKKPLKHEKETQNQQKEEVQPETKEEPSSVDSKPTKPAYAKAGITNAADNKIRSELDQADDLQNKAPERAIKLYDDILVRYPRSPRAITGRAHTLNKLAEDKQSNAHLESAIEEFLKVLDLPDVPKDLSLQAGRECAQRQSFRGWSSRATKTLRRLIEKFPEELALWNELGVQCLMSRQTEDARMAFKETLRHDASNGFAKVHLGFILKTNDVEYEKAIPYLQEGIASEEAGTLDGRFFFHLGDALYRTGKQDQAYKTYQMATDKGLFMSMWQRSLYNVETLTARPWWTKEQTGNAHHFKILEDNWQTIRDEGVANVDEKLGSFHPEEENLREKGDWKQFTLFQKGRRVEEGCRRAPKTCALLDKFKDSISCTRGQVKFSIMQPGVHVWPHCGPTNCRVRSHLGLVVPPNCCRIRVMNDTRTWEEGKIIVFDDSFEHEVWHDGDSYRLVLIVDLWHPELTARQKATLPPI